MTSEEVTNPQLNRAIIEAVISGLPTDATFTRRGATNAYCRIKDAYICVNLQRDKYKPPKGHRFCVNYGVQPVPCFHGNFDGLQLDYPAEIGSLFRSRLTPNFEQDFWWIVQTRRRLAGVVEEIRAAASLHWDGVISKRLTLEQHLAELKGKMVYFEGQAETLIRSAIAARDG